MSVGIQTAPPILAEQRTARLLSDAMLRRRFGEAGRNRAATFDWSAVTGQVLDLYDRLLSGRPGQAVSSTNSGP